MAIAEKLQNIINEKTSQATMTNYGLSSEEQINANTKFIDYPKYIFKAFIESLNNPNTLWGNLPKITGEGKKITLNNTIEAPMKIELKPSELEQATTTGKNILNISDVTSGSSNGISYVNNGDGTITFNGTASATVFLNLNFTNNRIMLENGAKYSLGIKNSNNGVKASLRLVEPNVAVVVVSQGESEKLNITSNYSNEAFVFIQVDNGTVLNNFTVFPMITKAATLGDYEMFTGNQASPNPSYPQQIHTISGDNEIVVCNKNLFDIAYMTQKNYNANGVELNNFYTNNNGILTINRTNAGSGRTFFNKLELEAGTYTISFKVSTSGSDKNFWRSVRNMTTLTDIIVSSMISSTTYPNYSFSFTLTDTTIIGISINPNDSNTGTLTIENLQLEKGSTASTYIEHKEQVYEIDLRGKNLFDKDNAKYLEAYLDNNSIISSSNYRTIYITCAENTTYTIQRNVGTSWVWLGYTTVKPAIGGSCNGIIHSDTITTGNGAKYLLAQVYRANADTNTWQEIINSIQIEKGSTATTYEPYNSIEYCEIGDYKDKFIRNSGKNLCDGVNQNVYLNQAVNAGGIASDNSGLYIEVNGGNYTISTTASQTRYRVACSNVIPPTVGSTTVYNGQNKDGTSNSITIDTTGYTYLIVNATDLSAIQIEKGSGATEYEPYGNGIWYIKKNIGKVVLDGTQTISSINTSSTNTTRVVYGALFGNLVGSTMICNRLSKVNNWNSDKEGISYDYGNDNVWFRINKTTIGTTENEINTYLSNNNIIAYIPISPTYTLLNNTLQEQLEDIYNTMKSYNGQTLISQNNNDLAFNISSSALQDLIG